MVDQVVSEPFSTPEFRQQTQFGSSLQLPVLRTECVKQRIGDDAPSQHHNTGSGVF